MKNPTGLTLVLIAILIGSAVLIGSGWIPGIPGIRNYFPGSLTIDEGWYIVYNPGAEADTWAANQLRDEYGATLISISTSNVEALNTEGSNLLFIGGSEELSGKVPWIETWPTLSVIKPGGFPNVYWDTEGWDNLWIHTPLQNYYSKEDGVAIHDYGLIAKGWDRELGRWIVVAIGYSGACTGASTVILIGDMGRVRAYSWIVYELSLEVSQEYTDPGQWRAEIFKPQIVAQG